MIWDLHHLTVPLHGGGPVPVLLVLDREHERLLLAVTVADTAALAHAAEVSINQLGSPGIIRSLQHQGTRELDEVYLARLQELGSSPRLVTLAAVTDTRWVNHTGDNIRAAITGNEPCTLAGLDSLLTQLCWTPWPTPDDYPLPVSVAPRLGQSMESWLEHLADANGLTTANLLTLARDGDGRHGTRYLSLAPSPEIVARLARVARVPEHVIRESSLAGLDGRGIDLTGLDHDDPNSYRTVAARGWAPAHGTQICPACLAEDGAWRTGWRLPIVTACTTHGTQLIASCPSCGRSFRDQRHSHLRRVGAATVCGNPLGQGPTRQCEQDLTLVATVVADPATLAMQRRVDTGLHGQPVPVLGRAAPAAVYLNDLKHLTTLVLHLATQPGVAHLADWAGDLAAEAAQRTDARGPRWGMRPPDNPVLRGRALAAADAVLAAADLENAAQALVPWVELTPRTLEGPLGWLADRTVMTPTMIRLVMAALAPHRRLSHHLDTLDPTTPADPLIAHIRIGDGMRLDTRQVPQVIPNLLYREHPVGAFDSTETTVRLFASLCLARADPDITSWSAAAQAHGLPPALGVRTARACSASMLTDNNDWTDRLYRVTIDLPRRDYRTLETQVRNLGQSSTWFDQWRRDCRPNTRDGSKTYALMWLWVRAAHGHLDTAAGRHDHQPTGRQRAGYRQFEATLDARQRTRLAAALDQHVEGAAWRAPSETEVR